MSSRNRGGDRRACLAAVTRSESVGASSGRLLAPGNVGHMNALSSRVVSRCGNAVVPVVRGTIPSKRPFGASRSIGRLRVVGACRAPAAAAGGGDRAGACR